MADAPNTIQASPTKGFFIQMLTKDIPLIRAIIDLVDNSIDGAIRLRNNQDFTDLWININVNPDSFEIIDNCGGIPLNVAKEYAFRFGRPKEAVATPHSVGLFGVGMKRAIFKMGDYFRLESLSEEDSYIVEQDIIVWSRDEDNWSFQFQEKLRQELALKENGTRIVVSSLHENIKDRFSLEQFITELNNQLEAAQQISLEKGISIKLNGHELHPTPIRFYFSDTIQPGYSKFELPAYPNVDVKIYTGVYERDLEKGGWYLYCNNRLVLYADQTPDTGWGGGNGLPKYHPDFAYCRGYVYFKSADASLLPWNTTKTGVDTDSPIFKAVRQEMTRLMRPVTTWLRSHLAREDNDGELHQEMTKSEVVSLSSLSTNEQVFVAPAAKGQSPDETSIQYRMSVKRVEKVKQQIGATSNSDVGRLTFEYYYTMECED